MEVQNQTIMEKYDLNEFLLKIKSRSQMEEFFQSLGKEYIKVKGYSFQILLKQMVTLLFPFYVSLNL